MLIDAGRRKGISMSLVDPARVCVEFSGRDVLLSRWTESGNLEEETPEGVFTRLGGSAPGEALRILKMMELGGVPCINGFAALELARDKAASSAMFARNGIPHPRAVVVSSGCEMEMAASILGGAPWVVKIPVSSGGSGVFIAESLRSLRSSCDMLFSLGHGVLIQEFISEAKGADTRVLVIGGEVAGAMRRQGREDDFRSNVHKGGAFSAVEISKDVESIALKGADATGLKIAGVDIIEGNSGPLVLEVNGSPGFESISSALGRDMAEGALDFFLSEIEKQ